MKKVIVAGSMVLLFGLFVLVVGCGAKKDGTTANLQQVPQQADQSVSTPSEAPSLPNPKKVSNSSSPAVPRVDLGLKNVLDGTPIYLTDYVGKVVMVNFWATWCPPCRHEIPDLIKLQQAYGPKGLQIVGVSVEPGDEDLVAQFVKENKINYPVSTSTGKIEEIYGTPRAVPTTYVLDRSGKVVEKIVGGRNFDEFSKSIQPHL